MGGELVLHVGTQQCLPDTARPVKVAGSGRHWMGQMQRPIVHGTPLQQSADVVHTWP
jgi:hypothetical protein